MIDLVIAPGEGVGMVQIGDWAVWRMRESAYESASCESSS